jgi:hypothetical protein
MIKNCQHGEKRRGFAVARYGGDDGRHSLLYDLRGDNGEKEGNSLFLVLPISLLSLFPSLFAFWNLMENPK